MHGFIAAVVVDGVLISIHFSKVSVDRAFGACCSKSLSQKLAMSLQQEIIVELCGPTDTCVRADREFAHVFNNNIERSTAVKNIRH